MGTRKENGNGMKAVLVEEYVKELSEIKPSRIPLPRWPPKSTSDSTTNQQPLILIRVVYTSPTHVDTLYARGLHQNNHAGLVKPPFILGGEFSGIVVDTFYPESPTISSSSPTSPTSPPPKIFHKGDKVWGTHLGTFTAYITTTPNTNTIHRIPQSQTLLSIASLGASTFPVSYGAIIQLGQLQPSQTILIHGASGGLGISAILIALSIKATVICTVSSEHKAQKISSLLQDPSTGKIRNGCGVIRIDLNPHNWYKEVLAITSPSPNPNTGITTKDHTRFGGVDLTIDTVGLIRQSIRCTKFGGKLIIVGFVGRQSQKMEEIAMNRLLLRGVHVIGYRFGESMRREVTGLGGEVWEGVERVLDCDDRSGGGGDGDGGRIKGGVIHRVYYGLDCVGDVLRELKERKVVGKVLVEVTREDAGGGDEMFGFEGLGEEEGDGNRNGIQRQEKAEKKSEKKDVRAAKL